MPAWLSAILHDPIGGAAVRIVAIIALTYLGQLGINALARRTERRVFAAPSNGDSAERLRTLIRVGRGVAIGVLLVLAGLMVLRSLGLDIVPLLASAGVAGLAISLGAQTLVKDYISGILILLERQFHIGDTIRAGEHQGEVERMTLRATVLRDLDGRRHIVPNGEIRAVSNLTAGWSRAVVDVNVAYDADMNAVLAAFEAAVARGREDPEIAPNLIEEPRVIGWNAFGEWAVQVRLLAKTLPGKQWGVAAALRRYVLGALEAAGIPVALPRHDVRVHTSER